MVVLVDFYAFIGMYLYFRQPCRGLVNTFSLPGSTGCSQKPPPASCVNTDRKTIKLNNTKTPSDVSSSLNNLKINKVESSGKNDTHKMMLKLVNLKETKTSVNIKSPCTSPKPQQGDHSPMDISEPKVLHVYTLGPQAGPWCYYFVFVHRQTT